MHAEERPDVKKILIVDSENAILPEIDSLAELGYIVAAIAPSDAEAIAKAVDLGDRFFEVSIDMLCFLDFNGYFRRLNPAWERTLGFTREELMSRPFIEFVHPDDRERTLKQNAAVRRGGKAMGFENRYLCSDGSYKWLRWNAAPHAADKVIYSVARDITEAKQAEAEREKLVDELRAALEEVQNLQAILPICSYCRKVRDDQNYWLTVESYLLKHTDSRFSHSICPSCMNDVVEPEFRPPVSGC
jgi:PAS domain S-box-containing protein